MNCPKCDHLLARIRYAGVNVLQCDQCGGHLVENHRVKTIERKVDKNLNALMAQRQYVTENQRKKPTRFLVS